MKYERFDIVLVNFPFTDLKGIKKRPSLVIKSLEGKNDIFCQITTKRRQITKYEIDLKKESCEGDIRFDSKIYLDMIFTLHENLTYGKIGSVKSGKVKNGIIEKLCEIFKK